MDKDNPFKIQEGSIRDGKIGSFIKDKKSGDYLDLGIAEKAERLGKFFKEAKVQRLFLLFVFVLFVLFGRTFYLQIVKGDYYLGVAEGNRIRNDVIKANRGLIYDRFGDLLVKNISYFFLYLVPDAFPQEEDDKNVFFDKLSDTLGIERQELLDRIEKKQDQSDKILIFENLEYEAAIKLIILSENEPSIQVSFEPRRQYFPELGMSHSLGYLSSVTEEDIKNNKYNFHDRIGKNGLELTYEDTLRGRDGVRQIEVDALFREKRILSITDPIDGHDVVLTIDAKSQEKLFEIMSRQAELRGKPKMAAVVLDPVDGGVLAMSSLPSYDNNIFTTVLNQEEYSNIINNENNPLLNRVAGGAYPLGSVFKAVIGSAALQEGVIDDSFRVNSTGGILVGGRFFPDWRPSGHGMTDIYWGIADSVNTFFYSIGGGNNDFLSLGLGADKIIEYAKKFGLGEPTGIDLSSEASGFLPSKAWKEDTFEERWYLGDTYNLSIGQGFLTATPLQGATLMSYFANNGIIYQPHFIKETIIDDQIKPYEPVKISLTDKVSSDNLNTIRTGMRMTVTKGTAQSMQSISVPVAGKTGTAQFNRNKDPHSWFAGFAPYDEPKIVITVLVEEGGDTGLAVTVAREFMEWYFSQ